MAERIRPRDQRSIPGDFVMLDRLGAADNDGVEDLLVFDFTGDFVSFLPFGRWPRFSKTFSSLAT